MNAVHYSIVKNHLLVDFLGPEKMRCFYYCTRALITVMLQTLKLALEVSKLIITYGVP